MTFDEYHVKAMQYKLHDDAQKRFEHAVFNLKLKTDEVSDIIQGAHDGHPFDKLNMLRELGDCLFILTDMLDILGYSLNECAATNLIMLQNKWLGQEERST